MLIAGNNTYGLAEAICKIYPDAVCASRKSGFDLTMSADQNKFAELAKEHDIIILCSALWKFNQTVLLDSVYKSCLTRDTPTHIICVGSTTDRVKNGKAWLYNAEKKALRDYSNTLALGGVWGNTPKITYVSYGTLSNNQHKHPDRKCIDIDMAASYIKWVIEQPISLSINEISIDAMQDAKWYK